MVVLRIKCLNVLVEAEGAIPGLFWCQAIDEIRGTVIKLPLW